MIVALAELVEGQLVVPYEQRTSGMDIVDTNILFGDSVSQPYRHSLSRTSPFALSAPGSSRQGLFHSLSRIVSPHD